MPENFRESRFGHGGKSYFATKVDPEKHAGGVEREGRSFKPLSRFFGDLRLADIRWTKIMEYRTKRLNEPIMRRGKPALIYRATKKGILLDGQSGTRVLTFPVKPCRRMMDL